MIEKSELMELLLRMNVTASQAEIEYWLGDNDENNDGLIDFGMCR